MLQGRSLHTRLLLGLLAVTAVGLLATGLVSYFTLRHFINERIEDNVRFAAEQATARLDSEATVPVGVDPPSPSPYFVVLLDLETGELDQLYGDTEREDVVLERISRFSREELLALGTPRGGPQAAGPPEGRPVRPGPPAEYETFELAGVTDAVATQRATVRLRVDGIVVVGMSTAELEEYPSQMVSTHILTGGGVLGGLVLAGQWLIGRGLRPLDRMATTANRISNGTDLSDRMPGAEPYSEVGRLGMAINTMLGRLKEAFQAQQDSEERVRAFAADASHELRTPLTTIRGYAELYRQGVIPPEGIPDAFRRIEDEAERMSRLVAELLELARLDQGSSLLLTRSDVAAVVRDMVSDSQALEPERSFTIEVPDALFWEVDETRFRQILANLLGNAREHTPTDAPVRLGLRTEPSEDGPGAETLRLEVADGGSGMPPEDIERAFDRFYRGDRSGAGSGLGLSIVWAIAGAHGGDVRIDSAVGEGTTVTVLFPQR